MLPTFRWQLPQPAWERGVWFSFCGGRSAGKQRCHATDDTTCLVLLQSAKYVGDEISRILNSAVDSALRYLDSVVQVAKLREEYEVDRSFDESVMYHLLTQVQLVRSWPVASSKEFSCGIEPGKLITLFRSLSRY